MGFRPLVYRLARARGLTGWVSNGTDGVHIEIDGNTSVAEALLADIRSACPPTARITGHEITAAPVGAEYPDFRIVESTANVSVSLLLTPDIALCPRCRQELTEAGNRREGYPFVTCTQCGPRYSIIRDLPYDRPLTTMAPFALCVDCQTEYDDPADRRFFSQTNSCPHCAVPLRWTVAGNAPQTGEAEDLIAAAVDSLEAGNIVAVKGIGGYLLCCDATRPGPVARLRSRKQRPAKPFAVLYPDLGMLAGDVALTPAARPLLTGPVSPVLLLPLRPQPQHVDAEGVAPGLDHLGVMLPYAPLLQRLSSRFGRPLVATSANVSGSPMIHRDATAQQELAGLADAWLG
ncbi:MAG: carbamoyltransferase HypF, partial [Bacteroidetes bacterium]